MTPERVCVRCILTQKVAAVFVKEPEVPHSSSQPSEEREWEGGREGEERGRDGRGRGRGRGRGSLFVADANEPKQPFTWSHTPVTSEGVHNNDIT